MRILITGSSGMLGSDLVKVLKNDGHYVFGFDVLDPRSEEHKPNEFRKIDLVRGDTLKSALNEIKADIIVHSAAWADVDGCENDPAKAKEFNEGMTLNLGLAASGMDVSFFLISTDYVFDGSRSTPYKEDAITAPVNVYGRTKLGSENISDKMFKNNTIIRTCWLYGKFGKNFVDAIIKKADLGTELAVVNDQVGSPTYTMDLASGISAIIGKGRSGCRRVVNVTNSGSCSWYDLAVEIIKLKGLSGKTAVRPISSGELDRPARRPAYSVMDGERLKSITGAGLRDWREALADYIGVKNGNL
ncbi:MAG: dTDP-4-dehydrorhamnose reductase [Candidatus Omnitrophica bacterium]|nr:dTDP-4-dehydrorhamnose reductase [Candidatus Omnitrophota bacterium]